MQEAVLLSLQLLKTGLLTGDPLEAPKGRRFPEGLTSDLLRPYGSLHLPPSAGSAAAAAVPRAALLLQRVASLLPLQQRPRSWWMSDLCMDLRGFNCLVSALRGGLRQLAEAALASKLLKQPQLVSAFTLAAAAVAVAAAAACVSVLVAAGGVCLCVFGVVRKFVSCRLPFAVGLYARL